jgi:hypothetical protein
MDDVEGLVHRAVDWTDDAAELDEIMTEMSAFSKTYVSSVCDAASALFGNAHSSINSGLTEYQSALCHVYIARGESTNWHRQAFHEIQQASDHLSTLKEAFKPLTVLGIPEYPLIEELSKHIADLRRQFESNPEKLSEAFANSSQSIWENIRPIEVPLPQQFGAPSLGQAQWLLDPKIACFLPIPCRRTGWPGQWSTISALLPPTIQSRFGLGRRVQLQLAYSVIQRSGFSIC